MRGGTGCGDSICCGQGPAVCGLGPGLRTPPCFKQTVALPHVFASLLACTVFSPALRCTSPRGPHTQHPSLFQPLTPYTPHTPPPPQVQAADGGAAVLGGCQPPPEANQSGGCSTNTFRWFKAAALPLVQTNHVSRRLLLLPLLLVPSTACLRCVRAGAPERVADARRLLNRCLWEALEICADAQSPAGRLHRRAAGGRNASDRFILDSECTPSLLSCCCYPQEASC